MANFREFYVPAGAGSNFLASKCLWANDIKKARFTNNIEGHSTSSNEFFFPRVRIGKRLKNKELIDMMVCDDENLLSETIRIKSILIELDEITLSLSPENHLNSITAPDLALCMANNRQKIISNIDIMWKDDWTMAYSSFWDWTTWGELGGNKIEVPNSVLDRIQQAQSYFVQCREYYYSVCERNNWNVEKISHYHSYDEIPGIKLPENFKSLAMEIDAEMDLYLRHLLSIKHDYAYIKEDWGKILTTAWGRARYNKLSEKTTDLFVNRSVSFSDDSVSYRKIFLENDADEIRKMYKFFDNEVHFDVNRTSIMKEFKEYHDNNMIVLQQFTPHLYKQTKYGKL